VLGCVGIQNTKRRLRAVACGCVGLDDCIESRRTPHLIGRDIVALIR